MHTIVILFAVIGVVLVLVAFATRERWETREWKLLGLVSFCVLPTLFVVPMTISSFEHMKTTEFCGSCHPMEIYIQSLTAPADTILASVHYRNNYVPQKKACYSCHVSYAMFGGFQAKLNGLHHVRAFIKEPEKEDIELYQPYTNDNCLYCHGKSERFRSGETHTTHHKLGSPEKFFARLESGELSCLETGCHVVAHHPKEIAEAGHE